MYALPPALHCGPPGDTCHGPHIVLEISRFVAYKLCFPSGSATFSAPFNKGHLSSGVQRYAPHFLLSNNNLTPNCTSSLLRQSSLFMFLRILQPLFSTQFQSPFHTFRCLSPPPRNHSTHSKKQNLFSLKIYLLIFREWEKEKERERNIDVPQKYQSVASHTPLTEYLVCNPGRCPDQVSNQRPLTLQVMPNPLSHSSQGTTRCFRHL